ncbi:MAG: tail fiber domain-containing protein [Elusimicrobia bacterium]|nr:tail fiber domain-containing protein [Elusimicrobiota bacterium]
MMRLAAFLCWLMAAAPAQADTKISGDAQFTGQLGVQTAVPRARAEIRLGAADSYVLRVSSADGTFMAGVDKNGRLALGVSSANARVDVRGTGDNGDIGLLLRAGNSSSTVSASQIVFAYDSTGTYRHSLRTRHVSGQQAYNSMDFYLWNSTADPTALGAQYALSLQAVATASSASVQTNPAGIGTYELEVSSSGGIVGGGTMMCGSVATHSSRKLKDDIVYLDSARERQAYDEVKNLKHVSFRYKMPSGQADAVLRRGLLYEEAPPSVRGADKSLIVDQRVLNLEMTLKVANQRVKSLEAKILESEKRRKSR